MQPTLYLYNLRNEKGEQIELLCLANGIACRHVNSKEYGKRIGYIAEIEGYDSRDKRKIELPFGEEMLVFKNFDRILLEKFLLQYRERGIATIALKAAITPTNVEWDSAELYAELCQERDEFLRQKEQ